MYKKILGGIAVLAIAAVAALNVNISTKGNILSSDNISLATVEALAFQEHNLIAFQTYCDNFNSPIFNDVSGVVIFPQSLYGNSMDCDFKINVPNPNNKFLKITVLCNTELDRDFVTVYSVDNSWTNPNMILQVSGSKSVSIVMPTSNGKALVNFTSDTTNCGAFGNTTLSGFSVFWELSDNAIPNLYSNNGYFTGKVGIGTDEPSYPLHVKGTSFLNGEVSIGMFFVPQRLNVHGDSYLNGNIGIGTATPENSEGWSRVTEIRGITNSKFIVTTSNSSSITSGLWSNNSSIYGAPAGGITGTWSNHPFSIITNKVNRMTILGNGNVGIGKTDPKSALDVNGEILTEKLLIKKPSEIMNWNDLLQSGFYDSYNVSDAPEPSQWFWGINMGHRNNSSSNRCGGQIVIRNSPNSPTMYFRSTDVNGNGTWVKVLHGTGTVSNYAFNSESPVSNAKIVYDATFNDANQLKNIIAIRNLNEGQTSTALRQSGIHFSLASEFNANESRKSAQILLESENAYANLPSLNFYTGNQQRMTILNDGNVGIGKTDPTEKLEVNGTIRANGSVILPIYNGFYIGSTGNAGKRMRLDLNDHSVFFDYYPRLHIRTGNGGLESDVMTMTSDGNVGIGVTNPNPNYKLEVNGTIRAKEVKLCLTSGCDYVFADNYKLMNLNDLSNFIKTNKHLPEIAPATEMEAEGINLSEMNALLLKKVEELTLYIIQQQKMMDKINEKIEKLENNK